jgi:hypothetical protein
MTDIALKKNQSNSVPSQQEIALICFVLHERSGKHFVSQYADRSTNWEVDQRKRILSIGNQNATIRNLMQVNHKNQNKSNDKS